METDLTDPTLAGYFRPTYRFTTGDDVEIFSASLGEWASGKVVDEEVEGKISVQYSNRMRVVDLCDPQLGRIFRVVSVQRPHPAMTTAAQTGDHIIVNART